MVKDSVAMLIVYMTEFFNLLGAILIKFSYENQKKKSLSLLLPRALNI